MELNALLDDLMTELKKVAQAGALVGKPFKLGSCHMVPLSRMTMGFGTGTTDAAGASLGRGGEGEGAGAGGALSVEPRAFVIVDADGNAQMLSMRNGKRAVLQHPVDLLPPKDASSGVGAVAAALVDAATDAAT
jgi:uncharacterized spore protein YtfJ